jgi:hypothetical protein
MTDAGETDAGRTGTEDADADTDGEGAGDGAGTARGGTDADAVDVVDDGSLAARLEALESEVDRLADVVERQRRTISFLTVDANLEPLDPAECPDCGEHALTRRSGLTWSKALCTSCGANWVLTR